MLHSASRRYGIITGLLTLHGEPKLVTAISHLPQAPGPAVPATEPTPAAPVENGVPTMPTDPWMQMTVPKHGPGGMVNDPGVLAMMSACVLPGGPRPRRR